MRRAFVLSLVGIVAIVAGCSPGQEEVKWPERSKHFTTLASLSPSTTEVVASLGYNAKLVGRTAACDYPPSVTSAPIVAQVKPDFEKLKAANPGLVVYDRSLYSDQDIAQIKSLGFETFEFKAQTIDDYAKEIQQYGSLIGMETDASAYVDKIYAEKTAAEAEPITPRPKVAVLIPGAGGEHLIVGKKSFEADVVKAAGGDLVGPDGDRFVPINAEQLIQLNPEMIIVAGDPDKIAKDPRLKSISAIAQVKVRGIPQEIVVRRGYRVDRNIKSTFRALQSMAQGTK